MRISKHMNKYVYQIQGALENSEGEFQGFRLLVCDLYNLDQVDMPKSVLDRETSKYLQFRLKITSGTSDVMDIRRLPHQVQIRIRALLGRWLDNWVLQNFYGDTSNTKGVNP